MAKRILTLAFYLLFFITPLLWAPWNTELFEYNKMMFVYLLTLIIGFAWLAEMLSAQTIILKKTPLDLPILLFLLANILSTVFSIDPHTSLWGYYSRSNGGLLSIISYTILYFALVSNFDKAKALQFLKVGFWSGLAVVFYAIPEHFGISPSCIILHADFSASCWVQNVQERVFATLGQPNWLAGYLAMLIFPSLYFALTAKTKINTVFYVLASVFFYLAFTFTYSRGGSLGLLAGLLLFFFLLVLRRSYGKTLAIILFIFFLINLCFGSALTSFRLIDRFAPPPRPTLSLPATTQLEQEGDQTGQIRFIVWQGAWQIFTHYPILGSGVETFAYSYYNFRPKAHNLVSEWDFLYNKAHNEFLNYLANTGIVGFGAYLAVIIVFIFWEAKKIFNLQKGKDSDDSYLLQVALLAAYLSYLIQNIFGFSVVIIALFFFSFPALAFLAEMTAASPTYYLSLPWLHRRSFYPKIPIFFSFIIFLSLNFSLARFYVADTFYAQGEKADEIGNAGAAYNFLTIASFLNPREPLYQSELAFAGAGAAVASSTQDATLSSQLKEEAREKIDQVLLAHPQNTSLLRTAIRTYYLLSTLDKSLTQKTLNLLDKAIKLSPTDPKLPFNKAVILSADSQNQEAIKELEQAINLKPNYREAYYSLALIYHDLGNYDQALATMRTVLKLNPNDADALAKIKEWGK